MLKVIAFPVGQALGRAANSHLNQWEIDHQGYGVRDYTTANYTAPAAYFDGDALRWQELAKGRTLLFVHGTFSRAHGAFNDLPLATMKKLGAMYDNRVIAFDHQSISRDPIENIDWLLGTIPDGLTLDFDIICHSRGGLVSRSLAERTDPMPGTRQIRVHRTALVGAVNNGTILADVSHWNDLINTLSTVLNTVGIAVGDAVDLVLSFVRQVAVAAYPELRGLACMVPTSDFLKELNARPRGENEYLAIASNYEPTDHQLKSYFRDVVKDRLFGGGAERQHGPDRQRLRQRRGGRLCHGRGAAAARRDAGHRARPLFREPGRERSAHRLAGGRTAGTCLMREYGEFRLRIERGNVAGTYRVECSGLGGDGAGGFMIPFSDTELENFVLKVGRTRRGVRKIESPEMQLARKFGGQLFAAVMQGKTGELYRAASSEARATGQGLRITLSLTDVPELGAIPWEYLYDDPNFLSINAWTPVVRYLDLPKPRRALDLELPLRILGVISNPLDAEPLDVELEKAKLEDALKPLREANAVAIDWLEEPTLLALTKKVRPDTYHILHFIGHGGFDDSNGEGALLFEDAAGRGRAVSGDQLAACLYEKRSLRLVLLNSCEGARNAVKDPFSGVAASLVQREIPAVIGMQFEITDRAAVLFASEFYAMLAEGQPIDWAISEARLAIWADSNDVEWGTPVLFMRVADGRLFNVTHAAALPRPAPQDLPAKAAAVVAVAPPVVAAPPPVVESPPVADEPPPVDRAGAASRRASGNQRAPASRRVAASGCRTLARRRAVPASGCRTALAAQRAAGRREAGHGTDDPAPPRSMAQGRHRRRGGSRHIDRHRPAPAGQQPGLSRCPAQARAPASSWCRGTASAR